MPSRKAGDRYPSVADKQWLLQTDAESVRFVILCLVMGIYLRAAFSSCCVLLVVESLIKK